MRVHKLHPYIIIILSFTSVILVGTGLLALPWAAKNGESFGFIDSLFQATSAVCVTGLSVINVGAEMTVYGKVVMCILMEIGGLSFLTFAVFFFTIIGAKIGISNRFLLKEALNQNSINGIVALVKKIVITSIAIQLIGTFINMFSLMPWCDYDFFKALGYSMFHSIAAFNNAGFDAFGANSMVQFKDDIILNASTIIMIILGGIGFIVLDEIVKKRSFKKLSLHSKITLITTVILILFGMFMIKFSSWNDVSWMQALFTSVTSRTAGFTTIEMSELSGGSYWTILILMFIGASPCSTGGGIKTTTIAIVAIAIFFFARGRKPHVFKRTITQSEIFKAFVLFSIAIIVDLFGAFLINAIQPELGIKETLFEAVSAFSTTGLTMGITSSLNAANRVIICILMLFGRLGPLTVIGVINKNWMTESKENIRYVEEKVIIG